MKSIVTNFSSDVHCKWVGQKKGINKCPLKTPGDTIQIVVVLFEEGLSYVTKEKARKSIKRLID